jgi:methylmalonyl-CoA/ethylmalonyl-CoA epimerase
MGIERTHVPIMTFDHIGVVVDNLDSGAEKLSAFLAPLRWSKSFDDPIIGVSVRFAQDLSGIVYELIAPFGDQSPVSRTLKSKVNLLNQIAYRTSDLASAVALMRRAGAVPVGAAKPAVAFNGARVQFLLSPLGFLIELIEIEKPTIEFSLPDALP